MKYLLAAAFALVLPAAPMTAWAGDLPSYATGDETIHGRIVSLDGTYGLHLRDDRGFIDNVTLHDGTVITPTGVTLAVGQTVTIHGHAAGSTFAAAEIDTPYDDGSAAAPYAGDTPYAGDVDAYPYAGDVDAYPYPYAPYPDDAYPCAYAYYECAEYGAPFGIYFGFGGGYYGRGYYPGHGPYYGRGRYYGGGPNRGDVRYPGGGNAGRGFAGGSGRGFAGGSGRSFAGGSGGFAHSAGGGGSHGGGHR